MNEDNVLPPGLVYTVGDEFYDAEILEAIDPTNFCIKCGALFRARFCPFCGRLGSVERPADFEYAIQAVKETAS